MAVLKASGRRCPQCARLGSVRVVRLWDVKDDGALSEIRCVKCGLRRRERITPIYGPRYRAVHTDPVSVLALMEKITRPYPGELVTRSKHWKRLFRSKAITFCPACKVKAHNEDNEDFTHDIQHGYIRPDSDSDYIARGLCRHCGAAITRRYDATLLKPSEAP